MMMMMMKFT